MEPKIISLRNFKPGNLVVDYKMTQSYKTKLLKFAKELTDEDIVPITYDVMFKTMLANSKRKKYLCRLMSLLFDVTEEEAMKLFKFSKNELDKDSLFRRGDRVDLVGRLGNVKINVEMNKTNTLIRNVEYLNRMSNENIAVGIGTFDVDNLSVQINLTDVAFQGDSTTNYFYRRDSLGRGLGNEVLVNISIPSIRKKLYTKGIESLDALERYLGMMSAVKLKEAKELAKGDELMMEYVKEAKAVEKSQYFDDGFDYEAHLISWYIEDGIRIGYAKRSKESLEKGLAEGRAEGRKEGRAESCAEIAKKMLQDGKTSAEITKYVGLSKKELEMLRCQM